MEFLLDLRTGDRAGATIRTPTTRVAAQLAGTVLEARHTTVADSFQALRLLEPPLIGLVAARATRKQLETLRKINTDLASATDDTARFIDIWWEAERITFSAINNPALTVIAEILHWIRVLMAPAITAATKDLPWVTKTSRNAQRLFAQFVTAASDHDQTRASRSWAKCMQANGAWMEDSELGRRPIIDLAN